jgi:flagellar basal body rod protein FlgF
MNYRVPGSQQIIGITKASRYSNAACLDFSIANEGYLTAYRWSGERDLTKNSLVSVPANGRRTS